MMAVRLLCELTAGEKGRIVRIEGGGAIGRRMTDMGAVAGTVIEVIRVAPLGDPMEVRLKGYNLSLRKDEAKRVKIEVS
jgi:Fe2+ transport system protein FeoA